MIWTDNPMEFAQNRIDSRQYILLPAIAGAIQKDAARSVLDYGCGEGYLARHLADKSAHIGLYDISDYMLGLASKNVSDEGFKKISVYRAAEEIPQESFDCVVLSLVLMTIGDDVQYFRTLSECRRAMRRNSCLIIGITHPCFRQFIYSTHHTKFTLNNEFDYFKNNDLFEVYLRTSKSERLLEFQDFHHNLSYTFSMLKDAGLYVEDFIELKDQSIEESYYNRHFSPYIMMKCRRREAAIRVTGARGGSTLISHGILDDAAAV
jgi:ubiquinone/menaquinone biosynthesis C-methylase UbiE